jgi:hypothetical protein
MAAAKLAKGKPSDLDVFSKFLEASWRGQPFYYSAASFGFEQQHVHHLYPDRDAGFIESTGRNPATFKFTALFRNGIAGSRLLFPVKYSEFMGACNDRRVGKLVHPFLGELNAKLKSQNTVVDMGRRDGVDVELEFVEASNAEDELADLFKINQIGNCIAIARDLDGPIGNISPVPEIPQQLKPSLLDSMKQLQGTLTQFKAGLGNITGVVDGYLGAIADLTDSISALDDPKNYPIIDGLVRLFTAVADAAGDSTKKSKPTTQVEVQQASDLASVAEFFRMSIDDLLQLNPALASRTSVAAGAAVFVYT